MKEIDVITEIRVFNRFYTNILGLLDQHILDSGYSLTEARVLFEISKTDHCTAHQLCSVLKVDRSYMSRIIRKFEHAGLVSRHTSSQDSRSNVISLTDKGNQIYHDLNDRSNQQIQKMISRFRPEEWEELLRSMRTVKKYFSIATKDISIRPFEEKDIPYVIDRQLSLYESERHFPTDTWVHYLAEGVRHFAQNYNPNIDCMLILECNGNPAGCIAVAHAEHKTAQLRYFFLEPKVRGLGVGTRLLQEALNFCREKGYLSAFLWTVSAQESARGLYRKAGFEITEVSENNSWGTPVTEEKWSMEL